MNYVTFSDERTEYPIAILAPVLRKTEIQKTYIDEFDLGYDDFVAIDLHKTPGKKVTPVMEIKEYVISELVPALNKIKAQYILVADSEYFKVLAGAKNAESYLGYVMESPWGDWNVIYVPNYQAVFYDPVKIKDKIAQGMNAMFSHINGSYRPPGDDIVKFEEYPTSNDDIQKWLDKLLAMDKPLAIDIEAFDLKHDKAGIATITFCWSKTEGIAFPVDYQPIPDATEAPFGRQVKNTTVRKMLRDFFEKLHKKAIYHNIAYDAYNLIFQLFMDNLLDTAGLLEGMRVMLRDWEDTKLISYLATNSCAGNKNGLKDQAQEYSGNWAVSDIKDVTKIRLPNLLRYNLVDGLSTWYVFEKRNPQMVSEDQEHVYVDTFKPATKDIIQMQLTGLPVSMKRVLKVEAELQRDEMAALSGLQNSIIVQEYTHSLNEKWVEKRNSELKVKRVTLADAKEEFNPRSPPQLQELLFKQLGLPILGLTDTKQPSTEGDILKALKNHTKDPDVLDFLKYLLDFKAVDIILGTFVKALKNSVQGPDGWHYMFGNFNLGGTVSGRLSSSNPNLQNLPASSKYAKHIKSCIEAPPGWVFVGLDFASLEDRISALTTKDPNKLKVYTDGYDGHCLRAYAYYGDQMPDIDPNSIASINSIADKYKDLRGLSKAPTFALTYQGTFSTLMKNCGFTEEMAKQVEARYHELYKVSDKWVADKLDQASKCGYVTGALGIKVRTPLLAQVIRGTRKTPHEAEAEGRTAGNALGQSWCLLNSRAGSEFMAKVRTSQYRLDIKPCAQIHDAQYFLVRDDIRVLEFVNIHLVEAVKWQDHPDIAHDEVKLGGELSIFYPTWKEEIVIPNGAMRDDIVAVVTKHLETA